MRLSLYIIILPFLPTHSFLGSELEHVIKYAIFGQIGISGVLTNVAGAYAKYSHGCFYVFTEWHYFCPVPEAFGV